MTPEPRENTLLFGHGAAEAAFRESLARGRMHHAWLLTGPTGIGKATLAFRLARRLLSTAEDPNDPADPVFRRIARGSHADLLTLEREVDAKTKRVKREISVDQVRAVGGFMHLTPAEGGWRTVLVDGLEDLNRNAANALLKILEEPPKRAILLLTCDAPGRLLPTIRSRCRLLRLDALSPEVMGEALAALLPGVAVAERAALATRAEGSPGQAVALAEEGVLALAALVEDVLTAPEVTIGRMHEIADKVTRGETGFGTFMGLLQSGIASGVRMAAGEGGHRMGARPLVEWGEVWHALHLLQDETERFNLDKRSAVVAGLQMLTKVDQGT